MNAVLPDRAILVYDVHSRRWLLFRDPVEVLVARRAEEVIPLLEAVERQVTGRGFCAAGFVAYEAAPAFDPALVTRSDQRFPPAWFGLYHRPEDFSFPRPAEPSAGDIAWKPSVPDERYAQCIRRIREYIRAGDTYQVNYTFRLQAPLTFDPWDLFVQMIRAQGPGCGAFLQTEDWAICSASPELFFRLQDRELVSRPMKGTVSRGLGSQDDRCKAAWLRESEKDRAENVMIVDMVRNDIGRIAEGGSVRVARLYDIEQYPTLWQMTSTVNGVTGSGLTSILRAMFPPASITGAPKVRTMQIIAELEDSPRRIYTGSIGFLLPGRTAQFNVAIRTVLVDRRQKTAEYGVGGGIVWDSAEDTELRECYTKAMVLTRCPPEFSLLETMLWTPEEGYFLLDRHLDRLVGSAAYFSYQVDLDDIRRRLAALAAGLPPSPHRIRLLVPREGEPTLESHALSPSPQPFRFCLAKTPVNSANPFLYHKTTFREMYEQAMREHPGCDDVLLWNEKGEVTESCLANVVIEMDGRLFTPPVHCGLLAGTYRSLLLEQGRIQERVIRVEDLRNASRVFLANSVRKLWEARLA